MRRDEVNTVISESEYLPTTKPTKPTAELSTLTGYKMVHRERMEVRAKKLGEAILLVPMDVMSMENLGRDSNSSNPGRKTFGSHLGCNILGARDKRSTNKMVVLVPEDICWVEQTMKKDIIAGEGRADLTEGIVTDSARLRAGTGLDSPMFHAPKQTDIGVHRRMGNSNELRHVDSEAGMKREKAFETGHMFAQRGG